MVLHQNVMSRIKRDDKHGGYDAVQYMMGKKTAELLAKSGFVNKRPTSEGVTDRMIGCSEMGKGGLKRGEREWEEDEGYVSAEMAGRQGQKKRAS